MFHNWNRDWFPGERAQSYPLRPLWLLPLLSLLFHSLCPQPTALMPKGRQKVPHLDAPLGLPTCLWLQLAGLFLLVPWVMGLAGTGGPDAQGTGGLSWAVHLDSLESEKEEESLEQQAHAVAQAAGLVNAGRIGELQGHYLFVQPAGHRQAMEVEVIRQQAEAVLTRHKAVRWHSEQRLLKRAKRSVHFNDPKYPQQWHLVSPALQCPFQMERF